MIELSYHTMVTSSLHHTDLYISIFVWAHPWWIWRWAWLFTGSSCSYYSQNLTSHINKAIVQRRSSDKLGVTHTRLHHSHHVGCVNNPVCHWVNRWPAFCSGEWMSLWDLSNGPWHSVTHCGVSRSWCWKHQIQQIMSSVGTLWAGWS